MTKKKKYALCTLFNSVYADKGIVLYNSLERVSSEFTLYVLAMDDKCYDILTDLKYPHLVPIKLSDFENTDLLKAKSNRSFGQYCWTCASSLIKYILDIYSPEYCTYLDADMYFYADPYILIEELNNSGKDVSLVGHRFSWYDKQREKVLGHFCVECNTFRNSAEAKRLLNIWIGKCIEDCSARKDGIHWGDQMYISNWANQYDTVIESGILGAGVAPWNISQYKLIDSQDSKIHLKRKGQQISLLFFHFEGITYSSKSEANIHVYSTWGIDDRLVRLLYYPYLKQIDEIKTLLKTKYLIAPLITAHPAMVREEKESLMEKWKRRIKSIFSSQLIEIFFHGLPSNLYMSKNFVHVDRINFKV